MKLGTNFAKVRRVIEQLGLLERARYVERATMSEERIRALPEIEPKSVPYFAMILIPGETWPAIKSGAALVPVTSPEEQLEVMADAAYPDAIKPDELNPKAPETAELNPIEPHSHAPVVQDEGSDYQTLQASTTTQAAPSLQRSASPKGRLAVVGLGPGAPEWLTPEAHAAIEQAEDILGYETYLRLAETLKGPFRPDQRVMPSDNRQELERARTALELAASGRRVVLLSSGDPGIFAMASAVLEALDSRPLPERNPAAQDQGQDQKQTQEQSQEQLRNPASNPMANPTWNPAWQEVPLEILPGISAAQALAARVGAPLGHDFCVLSLSDNLKPWDVIERRLRLAAEADLVIALYNPRSRARPDALGQALDILRALKAPTTPVALGHDIGRADERTRVLTLAALDPQDVDMRTVLIIGSSGTRTFPGTAGDDWVYTPRWSL
ncbi:Precorrin-3B C(17)-methyltransferase [Thiorhodovibrio litoralis]|nr:Precorrin-3B C(17)-methyltransferase [Thiorhodovibrio litoralis]